MSPPDLIGIVFDDHLDVVFVVEIGGGKNAILAARLEQHHRNH